MISDHSKSSRNIRPLPIRSSTAKALALPSYVIKPLKTISWADYNAAYKEERPFPISNRLVQRTISDLRAKALRPTKRLRNTRTGVKQDREIRRRESRLEFPEEVEERIDTITPSLRAPADGSSRVTVRRVPKLAFTTRTPSPGIAAPPRAQKRKVTSLLMTEVKEDGGEEVIIEEDWGAAIRPDPIIPDFFDELSQPQPIPVERVPPPPKLTRTEAQAQAAPGPSRIVLRVPPIDDTAPKQFGGKTTLRPSTTALPQLAKSTTTSASMDDDIGAFLQERLGEEELREIEARFPDIEKDIHRTTSGKTLLHNVQQPRTEDIENDDFPSVPSAPNDSSGPSDRPPPPARPLLSASDSSGGSKMMTGVLMAEHMMEALRKTKEMFAEAPDKSVAPPTGGTVGKGLARPRRRQKADEGGKEKEVGKAKGKVKGKGRDPAERLNERPRVESQMTLPRMLEHRPRATQLPSRTDIAPPGEDDPPQAPSSPRVTVIPPAALAPITPLARTTSTAPRLGLSRARTAGLATPLKTPLLGGKSMSTLKSRKLPVCFFGETRKLTDRIQTSNPNHPFSTYSTPRPPSTSHTALLPLLRRGRRWR